MEKKRAEKAATPDEAARTAHAPEEESSAPGEEIQPGGSHKRSGLRAQIRAALPFSSSGARREDYGQHDAEMFYLQKQIQQQTQMMVVLEDGRQVQGVIEWYDRNAIKIRGRQRVLVYKSAIKYIYKHGENSGNTMQ